jgi:hypothetical protein
VEPHYVFMAWCSVKHRIRLHGMRLFTVRDNFTFSRRTNTVRRLFSWVVVTRMKRGEDRKADKEREGFLDAHSCVTDTVKTNVTSLFHELYSS